MTKQIVIHTDLYEKSPISENYVFEGPGFAGSVNPKSRNVSVTEATAAPVKHDAFLDGDGDLWIWHKGGFRLWRQYAFEVPRGQAKGYINSAFAFPDRESVIARFGKGEEI